MFKKFLLLYLCIFFAVSQGFAADLLSLVPAEAIFVVQVNMKQLVTVPEIKAKIDETLVQQGNDYIKYVKDAGFDPFKDVDGLLMYVPRNIDNKDRANANIAIIAEGRFNPDKTMSTLTANPEIGKKLSIDNVNGMKAATYYDEKSGNSTRLLFLDNKTLIVGTETGVSTVIAVKSLKKPSIKSNKDFAVALKRLSPNSTLSGVAVLPEDVKASLASNDGTKEFAKMNNFRFDITKTTDVAIRLIGDFSANADMKSINTTLTQFGDMLKQTKAPYMAFEDFAKNYKVETKGRTSSVSSLITKAAIDKLLEDKGRPENRGK